MIGKIYRFLLFLYWKSKFGELHASDIIRYSRMMTPKSIFCGENVIINFNARIQGVEKYNDKRFTPKIEICDGVHIQQNLHMTCANHIVIGRNTAIAANVTITDVEHLYSDPHIPIMKQDITAKDVIIGEDCMILNNAVILPGCHIGKHVVVGANSIVSGQIPDYSVVVGAPARIVKTYDSTRGEWIKR